MTERRSSGFYPALLKYWRGRRGWSQLDLANAAEVSARHVSFLETGRSQPSREMLLCLAVALDVPMRSQNEMLTAAGFPARYEEVSIDDAADPAVRMALDAMLTGHEPFPVLIMDGRFDIVRTNHAGRCFLEAISEQPSRLGATPNAYEVFLCPWFGRDSLLDWPEVAALLVAHLHHQVLHRPGNARLRRLLDDVLALPDIPPAWRAPDLEGPASSVFTFRFAAPSFEGSFLTTLTTFNSPNNITLDELYIESYYPLDDATRQACAERFAEPTDLTIR